MISVFDNLPFLYSMGDRFCIVYGYITYSIGGDDCDNIILSTSYSDKDQRSNPWESWPDDVILLHKGCFDKIIVPPSLYKSFQGIYVTDVEIWECLQWHLVVFRRIDSPRVCVQSVFISTRHTLFISSLLIPSCVFSKSCCHVDVSRLLTYCKRIILYVLLFLLLFHLLSLNSFFFLHIYRLKNYRLVM